MISPRIMEESDEYANRRVCSVDDLMRTVLASRKAEDVTLLQPMLTFRRAERRLAAKHDHPLIQVARVVGPEPVARLDLGHGRAGEVLPMRWPTSVPLLRQSSRISEVGNV